MAMIPREVASSISVIPFSSILDLPKMEPRFMFSLGDEFAFKMPTEVIKKDSNKTLPHFNTLAT